MREIGLGIIVRCPMCEGAGHYSVPVGLQPYSCPGCNKTGKIEQPRILPCSRCGRAGSNEVLVYQEITGTDAAWRCVNGHEWQPLLI